MVYYPMSNSVQFRSSCLVEASDLNNAVKTPEGWKPGDKVIVPPPATVAGAEDEEGYGAPTGSSVKNPCK